MSSGSKANTVTGESQPSGSSKASYKLGAATGNFTGTNCRFRGTECRRLQVEKPGTPGFSIVRIDPHLGKLLRAEGKAMHPKGEIIVSLVREKDVLRAKITLPADVTGTFVWKGKSTDLRAGEQSLTLF